MPLLNFQTRFVPLIIRGTKVHTVRMLGHRLHRAGETLYMQYGPRFHPLRFATPVCQRVRPIDITRNYARVWNEDRSSYLIPVPDLFARADGFEDWDDLRKFFVHVPRLNLQLVQWAPAVWEVAA